MYKLYYNAQIRTMCGDKNAPKSVIVRDAVIDQVLGFVPGEGEFGACERVDLGGGALLPGFIDAHSHYTATASAMLECDLSEITNMVSLCEALAAFAADNALSSDECITGRGYDNSRFEMNTHPDTAALDKCLANPIAISHVSGHSGVFNTRAQKLLGITSENGYLEEKEYIAAIRRIPVPGGERFDEACRRTCRLYASHGITTAQEGLLLPEMLPLLRTAIKRGNLLIDLVGYAEQKHQKNIYNELEEYSRGYRGRFRLGGEKIMLDGSPQSRTAYMREEYVGGGRGVRSMDGDEVFDAVCGALRRGRQLLAHCNGDAACDEFISACERATGDYGALRALRAVMIHAQFLRRDQLKQVKSLGIIPSFFVSHIYHFGDTHIGNLGISRAMEMSAAGSAQRQGIRYTFHTDTPVLPPDMLDAIGCAVGRVTRSGVALDASERVSVQEALAAITVNAAYQYGEEGTKGSIEPGKRADMTLLSCDPCLLAPSRAGDAEVLRTIKDGKEIYRKEG